MSETRVENTEYASLDTKDRKKYLLDFYQKTVEGCIPECDSTATQVFSLLNVDQCQGPEGEEKEEEVMLLKLTIFHNIVTKQEIVPAILLSPVTIKCMIRLVKSPSSPYISYSAFKCLKAVLRHMNLASLTGVITEIFYNMQDTKLCSSTGTAHLLDTLCNLFSKRERRPDYDKDSMTAVLHALVREFRVLIGVYISQGQTLTETDSSEIYSFLSLWNKIIKFQLRMDLKNVPPAEDSVDCIKPVSQLLEILLKTETVPRFVLRKALKIINNCLSYSVLGEKGNASRSRHLRRCLLQYDVFALLDLIPKLSSGQSFGGDCEIGEHSNCLPDITSYRKLALIIVKSVAMSIQSDDTDHALDIDGAIAELAALYSHAQKTYCDSTESCWLLVIFGDQDDQLVEAMLCLLDVYLVYHRQLSSDRVRPLIQSGEGTTHQDFRKVPVSSVDILDPHVIFLDFLKHTGWDSSLILDLLTSPETCFLAYLLKYLRYIVSNWQCFIQTCQSYTPVGSREKDCDLPCEENQDSDDFEEVTNDPTPVKKLKLIEYSDSDSESGDLECESSTEPNSGSPCESLIINDSESGDLECESTQPNSGAPCESLIINDSRSSDLSNDLPKHHPQTFCSVMAKRDSVDESCSEVLCSSTGSHQAGFESNKNEAAKQGIATQSFMTSSSVTLDDAMSVLIRLNLAVQRLVDKGLFPYNAKPLIKLLDHCEEMYET